MDYSKLNKRLVKAVSKGCSFSGMTTLDMDSMRIIIEVDASVNKHAAKNVGDYFTGATASAIASAAGLRGKLRVVSSPTYLSVCVKDEKGKTTHELKSSNEVVA
jgi:hypothetical protein